MHTNQQNHFLPTEPQGSPVILEWVAYPFSRGPSRPRNWTGVSCIAGGFFTNWAIRDSHFSVYWKVRRKSWKASKGKHQKYEIFISLWLTPEFEWRLSPSTKDERTNLRVGLSFYLWLFESHQVQWRSRTQYVPPWHHIHHVKDTTQKSSTSGESRKHAQYSRQMATLKTRSALA